jgi:hypothetical protein
VKDEVVGLGAWCDFGPSDRTLHSPGSVSFAVHEVAELADGTRITLHADRGFAVSGPILPSATDPLAGMSAESIQCHVLTTVAPEDPQTGDDHPYEALSVLLHQHGVKASADSLRTLPYTVEFSQRLQNLLTGAFDE